LLLSGPLFQPPRTLTASSSLGTHARPLRAEWADSASRTYATSSLRSKGGNCRPEGSSRGTGGWRRYHRCGNLRRTTAATTGSLAVQTCSLRSWFLFSRRLSTDYGPSGARRTVQRRSFCPIPDRKNCGRFCMARRQTLEWSALGPIRCVLSSGAKLTLELTNTDEDWTALAIVTEGSNPMNCTVCQACLFKPACIVQI
jgi:hypothetical protein